ncbi:MAG: hypothetical protein AAB368_01125, partial [bacterium]
MNIRFAIVRRAIALAMLMLAGATGWDWRSWSDMLGGVRVVSFSPQGWVRARAQVIRIRFSQDVGPERVRGSTFTAAAFLRIEPELAGTFVWENRRTLVFSTSGPLARNARYRFTVLPEVAHGRGLAGRTEFELATAPFAVAEARAYRKAASGKGRGATYTVGIRFTYPVNSAELKPHVTLVDARGRSLAWAVARSGKADVHTLTTGPWTAEQAVAPFRLTLAEGLPCDACRAPLGRTKALTLAPREGGTLRIEEIAPETGGEKPRVRVRFSSPVDPDNVSDYLGIEPAVEAGVTGRFTELELSGFTSGETYKVTFRKGLRATDGAVLAHDDARTVALSDIAPSLRFRDEGFYLSRGGGMSVMVESINVPIARVVVDKVFTNNLVHLLHTFRGGGLQDAYRYYYHDGAYRMFGTRVLEHDLVLGDERNAGHHTPYSLAALEEDKRKGLFRISLQGARARAAAGEAGPEEREEVWDNNMALRDSKWVLVTDIGLIGRIGKDRLTVFANSLSTLRALSGVKLTLFSENNQPLAEVATDREGRGEFRGLSGYGADGMTPFLVHARSGADESFLLFRVSELPLADLEVDGRPEPQGLQAYLWTDRGVYRPDDTAHIAGIVRTETMAAPSSLPL